MSGLEITIRLAIVAVLAGYLYSKHRQRVYSWYAERDPAKWSGRAIDVAKLKPKVEELRRDYLTGRASATGRCFHRCLLNLARQVVVRLAYFHDREPQAHEHTHSP